MHEGPQTREGTPTCKGQGIPITDTRGAGNTDAREADNPPKPMKSCERPVQTKGKTRNGLQK